MDPRRALEQLLLRSVKTDFAAWCRYCGYEPSAHHQLIIRELEAVVRGEVQRLAIFMPPGSAKALALDTPIATPQGWSTMGALKVGDQVFDEQGQPCRVTWKGPVWQQRPVYNVMTDCGDVIVADHDHEWLVRLCGKPRKALKKQDHHLARPDRDDPASQFKIKETHQLARRRVKRPMIKRAAALQLPPADLSIDPYLLGIWLGDGSSAGMRVTSPPQDQPFIRQRIEAGGAKTKDQSIETLFGVSGVRASFVALGLLNDPHHNTTGRKHIPPVYLRASVEQRMALLQGLVDTDGHVCRDRGCTTFGSIYRELAEQVRELVRSLGVKAGWSVGQAVLNGVNHGDFYRVSFYLQDSASLPRKAEHTRNQWRTPDTYVDAVAAGFADTVCIEIDSPSHLFLAGRSMTPTHNSTYASVLFPPWFMANKPGVSLIAASHTEQLAERFGRRVRNLVEAHADVLGINVAQDNRAAGRWALEKTGAEYTAAGVGGAIAGWRAGLALIDDPVRGREDSDSPVMRAKAGDWYSFDLIPRLTPQHAIILIQCMTGDTPVLIADGTERPLRDIRPGDAVATYAEGGLGAARVLNWASRGSDAIYLIRMNSGTTVRANERHPFLVARSGGMRWVRLRDLTAGDAIVRATRPQERHEPFCATIATSSSGTERPRKFSSEPLDTFGITPDVIASITGCGVEEVFDIQVKDTENFIANGLVSHNTRWNEDDLAGRILEAEGANWRVITLPMECESVDDPLGRKLGERLWPEWFTEAMVKEAKADPRKWSALYQQRPAPEEGNYFRRDWLHPSESLPDRASLRVYGGSDYAVTSDGGDFTVHVVVGIDPDDKPWLLDVWRSQSSSEVWIEAFCDLVRQWKPLAWAEEGGQIRASLGPYIERRQRERKAYVFREQFASRHDKSIRAQAIRGFIATQGLYYRKEASWRSDFETELLMFPAGRHDDQVDALSVVGQLLDQILAGVLPAKPKLTKMADYRVIGGGPAAAFNKAM